MYSEADLNTYKPNALSGAEGDPSGVQGGKRYTVPFSDNSASCKALAQLYRLGPNPTLKFIKQKRN